MDLGKSIRNLRKNKQWSQEMLAARAGITQAALSQIENGQRPSPETVKKICTALGIQESLLYAMGIERTDVPEKNQILYDQLFPVIQQMISTLANE